MPTQTPGLKPLTLLALYAASLSGGCTWTPKVGDIEPERIKAGSFAVLRHEAIANRDYVFVVRDVRSYLSGGNVEQLLAQVNAAPRSTLDVRSGEVCTLPGRAGTILRVVNDFETLSTSRWRQVVYVERGDGKVELSLFDQHCQQHGPTLLTNNPASMFTSEDSGNPELLVLTESGELWHLDPWQETLQLITEDVTSWSYVVAPPNDRLAPDERGLILVQSGQLVVRRMDGEEIARFGTDVGKDFSQTNLSGLRVAFEMGGNVYEAFAPDLSPQLVDTGSESACTPRYSGARLSYFSPCNQRQYTRLNLLTGEVETFPTGTYFQYSDRGWRIEYRQARPDPDQPVVAQQWIAPPGAEDLVPLNPWLTRLRPLSGRQITGTDPNATFGVWTPDEGFQVLAENVATTQTYVDQLSTSDSSQPVFLWIVHHDVVDGVGTVSLLSATDFQLQPVVQGVPVGAFTTFQLTPLLDPALVILRDFTPEGATLDARLIPGLVGATIDTGVFSFAPRTHLQEPGLYYSIGPGEREGIWFAPL